MPDATPARPLRVLVTGDRHWECPALARAVVARLKARYGEVVLIEGGARGVDHAFHDAATEAGFAVESYPVDSWKTQGKKAGPLRNAKMIATGVDFCIAVHRYLRNSKGTRDCVSQCLKAGVPVWLIDSEVNLVPKALTRLED